MMGHSLLGVSCLQCPSGWAASEQGPPGVPPPRGFSPAPPQVPPMHRWASPHHHTHPSLASRTNREVRRKEAGPPGGVGPVQARRRPAGSLWGLRASLAEKQPLPHTHPCPAPPTLVACVVSWPIPSPGPFWGWGAPGSWGAEAEGSGFQASEALPRSQAHPGGDSPALVRPPGDGCPNVQGLGPSSGRRRMAGGVWSTRPHGFCEQDWAGGSGSSRSSKGPGPGGEPPPHCADLGPGGTPAPSLPPSAFACRARTRLNQSLPLRGWQRPPPPPKHSLQRTGECGRGLFSAEDAGAQVARPRPGGLWLCPPSGRSSQGPVASASRSGG